MRCVLVDTYNASPLGKADPIDLDEFITWLTSLGTDHAHNQLLLAKLKREWKITAQKIMLGKKYLASTDLQTYLPLIQSFNDTKIQAASGLDSWNALPEEEKTRRDVDVSSRHIFNTFNYLFWITRFVAVSGLILARHDGKISLRRSVSRSRPWFGVAAACIKR
jgi:hypothetical protein